MKLSYNQAAAIVRHMENLRAIFPNMIGAAEAWDKLQRLEQRGHRLAENYCNGWIDEAAHEKAAARILAAVDAVTGYKALGVPVFLNGDPRGYALKIDWTKSDRVKWRLHSDMGGYGILAPEFSK